MWWYSPNISKGLALVNQLEIRLLDVINTINKILQKRKQKQKQNEHLKNDLLFFWMYQNISLTGVFGAPNWNARNLLLSFWLHSELFGATAWNQFDVELNQLNRALQFELKDEKHVPFLVHLVHFLSSIIIKTF